MSAHKITSQKGTFERLRRKKGWTLRELGRRTGLDYTYLSKIENGHHVPSDRARATILTALGRGCGHRCEVHR